MLLKDIIDNFDYCLSIEVMSSQWTTLCLHYPFSYTYIDMLFFLKSEKMLFEEEKSKSVKEEGRWVENVSCRPTQLGQAYKWDHFVDISSLFTFGLFWRLWRARRPRAHAHAPCISKTCELRFFFYCFLVACEMPKIGWQCVCVCGGKQQQQQQQLEQVGTRFDQVQ